MAVHSGKRWVFLYAHTEDDLQRAKDAFYAHHEARGDYDAGRNKLRAFIKDFGIPSTLDQTKP
jgi:hypothetical protein